MSHPETVPVEQVDREAAAPFFPKIAQAGVLVGTYDADRRVQAFARHRLAHAPGEGVLAYVPMVNCPNCAYRMPRDYCGACPGCGGLDGRAMLAAAPSEDAATVERVAETIRDEVRHRLSIVVKDGEATARRVGEIITSCCHSINWSPRFRAAIRAMQKEAEK